MCAVLKVAGMRMRRPIETKVFLVWGDAFVL
jgi:hypothetical protein